MVWGLPGVIPSAVIRPWWVARRYELGVQAGGPGRWMVARKLAGFGIPAGGGCGQVPLGLS